ncbi:MAG: hypothetical protein ACKOX1_00790 [Ignavibacteria bacterium]
MRIITILLFLILQTGILLSQDGKGFSVTVEAKVQSSPKPAITLTWNSDDRAESYAVFRKDPTMHSWSDQAEWGSAIANLGKDVLSYTDENVTPGIAYEYQVLKVCTPAGIKTINLGFTDTVTTYFGSGYVLSGINVSPILSRGTVILLIDSTMVSPLSAEITRLEQDLKNELWTVVKRTAPRATAFNPEAVATTKEIIFSIIEKNPNEQYSILLLGRIPVPYSGLMAPDGHSPDHVGAWPADVYYADFDGEWADESINSNGASRAENKNIPGDGKFDKSANDADIKYPIGRIDFYNLTSFAETEVQLLKRYLDKNHAFRSGEIKPVYSATVDDNFGAYGEGFSGSAYRGFGGLVGKDNIVANREFLDSTITTMFSYGCGAGSYTSCAGVGGIAEFSKRPITSVFTMIFGSYFGDWDSKDNVMRSVVASRGTVLTTGWAARPHWFFHPMGLGKPIGEVLLGAQNNTQQYLPAIYNTKRYPGGVYYQVAPRGTHIALIGDPTLRMTSNMPIETPKNIGVTSTVSAQIDWESVPNASGYLLYKSSSETGPFEPLTPSPITETTFHDIKASWKQDVVYQVRAVMLRETKSGSFYEVSAPNTSEKINVSVDENTAQEFRIACSPQPMSYSGIIQFVAPDAGQTEVSIHTMDGRLLKTLLNARIDGGAHSLVVPAQELPIGMYMVRIIMNGASFSTPLLITR